MNPQLIQSIMQMLRGNMQQNQSGFGAGGFSTDPGSDIANQLQVGQPLNMNNDFSSMGGQANNYMSGLGGMPGMGGIGFGGQQQQSLIPRMLQAGRAGMNANRANQAWSSFLPDTTSTISSLMR